MRASGIIRRILARKGYELIKRANPATDRRPVGNLLASFEDLRARGFQAEHIVDVGANHGEWSRTISRVYPEAKFYLFEPVPLFATELQAFTNAHVGSRYWAAAVSSTTGEIQFNQILTVDGRPTPGSSARKIGPLSDPRYFATSVSLPAVALDALVALGEIPATPDIIKIDVEGYEMEALKGCGSLVGRVPVFLLEVSFYAFWGQPLFHEFLSYMADNGYLLYDFCSFSRRPRDGALGQADALFVKADSSLRRPGGWGD